VFIVELRHISGMLFDDDRNSIPFPGELEIIEEVVNEVKKACPFPFEFILVITGLKIVGVSHVNKMLDHIRQGKEKFPHLIAGFDLVNEEEFTEPISAFMPEILGAIEDKRAESKTEGMQCFFHAGETHNRNIFNLHDSVLLNTRRIGHGFQLALFPNLIEEVKKRDICVEVCPLSNMVLGYTLDLRTHPVRYLLNYGVQVSISPDDPTFFDYQGVTLDYVFATLAWELDIRDLKKMSLNGITYSSIAQEKRDMMKKDVFPKKWATFIDWLCAYKI
jgi:adenosine deaminase CECR1